MLEQESDEDQEESDEDAVQFVKSVEISKTLPVRKAKTKGKESEGQQILAKLRSIQKRLSRLNSYLLLPRTLYVYHSLILLLIIFLESK